MKLEVELESETEKWSVMTLSLTLSSIWLSVCVTVSHSVSLWLVTGNQVNHVNQVILILTNYYYY